MFRTICSPVVSTVVSLWEGGPVRRRRLLPLVCVAYVLVQAGAVRAQVDFERPPIDYLTAPVQDPAAKLAAQLESGEATLQWDPEHGWLPSLLKALGIDDASQMLVFSKTSLQLYRISPQTPRALYFNDDSYVGWVPEGDVLEITSIDPELGAIFYTLTQQESDAPRLVRDRGQCLTCHASHRTQNVPGLLVRSVFADERGQPRLGSGTFTIDHTSPFEKRWGGWYVTGTHGEMRHMGNVLSKSSNPQEGLDREAGANVTDLSPLFPIEPYLQPGSDIVALMVLEHQSQLHNLITRASYEARHAAHLDGVMNEALGRDPNHRSESTQRRIAAAGDKLLEYLLFAGEAELTAEVQGVSKFRERFEARGPRDSHGRSLRDFDLQRRMFRYPCSYLIYSPAYDALPDVVRQYVGERLQKVLTGEDQSDRFRHLSPEDRQAIFEILKETKPEVLDLSEDSKAGG